MEGTEAVKGFAKRRRSCQILLDRLNWCNITDVTALSDTLAQTQALMFLKELDLRYNKIKEQKQLRELLKSSNCELILHRFSWSSFSMKPRGVQLSSDEEDEDTSSQNVKPKDQV